jgi:fructose-1,6-bisphosphatase/inositol monophosphatase family enzyme
VEQLDFAIELARAAGDVLKHYMSREKRVELKGFANLVTVADKESEALIIGRIRDRYPNHAILAEESGSVRFFRGRPREVGSSIRSTARRISRINIRSFAFPSV